jgi:hypothetical protein
MIFFLYFLFKTGAGAEKKARGPTQRFFRALPVRGASNAGMRASELLPVFEEFLRLLLLQAHRETEAHFNATNRTRSGTNARHSTNDW